MKGRVATFEPDILLKAWLSFTVNWRLRRQVDCDSVCPQDDLDRIRRIPNLKARHQSYERGVRHRKGVRVGNLTGQQGGGAPKGV